MRRLPAFFNKSLDVLGELSVFGMVVCLFLQVVTRYIFAPLSWTEELARYFFIWAAFVGAAIVAREDGHIMVDFFTNLLPKKTRVVLNVVGKCLTIIFFAALLWGALPLFGPMFQYKSSALRLPMFFVFFCIPLSAVAIICYYVANIRRLIIRSARQTDSEGVEIE